MERKMSVSDMRMLSWMSGLPREDRIRNEYIRGRIGVASIGIINKTLYIM